MVLADPPADSSERTAPPAGVLIALSARSAAALKQRRHDLACWLVANPDAQLADIAYTLGCGRHHFEQRWACVVMTRQDLQAALEHGSEQNQNHSLPESRRSALQSAAQAYLAGDLPDFASLAAGGRRIPLPTYPFEERAYWLTPPETNQDSKVKSFATSSPSIDLPKMMTPVWEPSPLEKPDFEGVTLCIAGDPDQSCCLGPGTANARGGGQGRHSTGSWFSTGVAADCSYQRWAIPSRSWRRCLNNCGGPAKTPAFPFFMYTTARRLAAAAIAAAPSMRFLYKHFSLRSIALPSEMPLLQAAEHLLAELSASESEAAINSRGERLVRRLRTVDLSPGRGPEPGGVWLITGGLGGLGPHLARHLALSRGAKIGLLGRSPLEGDKSQTLKALRAEGVNAHYVRADVADPLALAAAIAELEAILGPLDGVIHAAGVPSQRPLAESEWSDVAATLHSKIDGTLVLDRVLAERPLRAFVLFSSLAAEFGDFGQCDYAIANAFSGSLRRVAGSGGGCRTPSRAHAGVGLADLGRWPQRVGRTGQPTDEPSVGYPGAAL